MRLGPWYGDGEESHRSCRHLRACVTEFGAEGLELDGALLAWSTDLVWEGQAWSNARAKRHARSAHVRDPFQLRVNAYGVLLTRGRDGAVIFVPPLPEFDATAAWLQACGVKVLQPTEATPGGSRRVEYHRYRSSSPPAADIAPRMRRARVDRRHARGRS
jgi:hypothetical protein